MASIGVSGVSRRGGGNANGGPAARAPHHRTKRARLAAASRPVATVAAVPTVAAVAAPVLAAIAAAVPAPVAPGLAARLAARLAAALAAAPRLWRRGRCRLGARNEDAAPAAAARAAIVTPRGRRNVLAAHAGVLARAHHAAPFTAPDDTRIAALDAVAARLRARGRLPVAQVVAEARHAARALDARPAVHRRPAPDRRAALDAAAGSAVDRGAVHRGTVDRAPADGRGAADRRAALHRLAQPDAIAQRRPRGDGLADHRRRDA